MNKNSMSALNYLTKANEINPNDIECVNLLGHYYLYEYNFKKASSFFKKSIQMRTEDDLAKADNLNSLGLCLLNIGETINSIEILENALILTKKILIPQLNTGEHGISEVELLNSKIFNNLGNAYRNIKDFDNSLKYYLLCVNIDNLYTKQIACFNLGTMLIARGELLSGINYLEKVNVNSVSADITKYMKVKGISFIFEHDNIKEAIVLYYNKKFNNSVIKLKSIYNDYGNNPIVNFFLAYDYLALFKFEKSSCFFNKLLHLNVKYSFEKFTFVKRLIKKASLIAKKIPYIDQSENTTYVNDLMSFIDFAYISKVEEYDDNDDESLHNKINTELNIALIQTERTKRIADVCVTSYDEIKRGIFSSTYRSVK